MADNARRYSRFARNAGSSAVSRQRQSSQSPLRDPPDRRARPRAQPGGQRVKLRARKRDGSGRQQIDWQRARTDLAAARRHLGRPPREGGQHRAHPFGGGGDLLPAAHQQPQRRQALGQSVRVQIEAQHRLQGRESRLAQS
jgi:hypothetical protein